MITCRLADALPRAVLQREAGQRHARRRLAIDRFLDSGYGSCALKAPDVAHCVIENWRHFDGDRYRLHAWVVMPNHVHVIIDVREGHPLAEIVHGWKSYTAHAIRRLRGDSGRVWQPEYWDRMIRDDLHFFARGGVRRDEPRSRSPRTRAAPVAMEQRGCAACGRGPPPPARTTRAPGPW